MSNAASLISQLQSACQDLLWSSEADYPFEVICWDTDAVPLSAHQLLDCIGQSIETPVETESLEQFFGSAVTEQDWHDAAETARVEQYRQLVKLLQENLIEPRVYRVGKVDIEVYILGRTEDGEIVGLSTKVVET